MNVDGSAPGRTVRDRLVEEAEGKCVFFRAKAFAQVEVPLDLAAVRANLPEFVGRDLLAEQARVGLSGQVEIHHVHTAGDVLADGHAVREESHVLGVIDQGAFSFLSPF